jgi:hypothetical protein
MYKKVNNLDGTEDTTIIKRTSDNAFIPTDSNNADYQEYLEWVAQGNTIEDAD